MMTSFLSDFQQGGLLVHPYFYVFAVLYLFGDGFCADHGKAQASVGPCIQGKSAVGVGGGEQAVGGWVYDGHADEWLTLFARQDPSGDADDLRAGT